MQIGKCNVISGYVGFYLGFLLVQRQCGAHIHTPQLSFTITLKVLRGSIMLLALRKLPVIGLSFVHIITSNMRGISILNVAIICC